MLKINSHWVSDILLGQGLGGIASLVFDRIKFYTFYRFYYPRKFKFYGKNIRWGRDFRRYVIPTSIRLSCPEKISIGDNCQFDEFVFIQTDVTSAGIKFGNRVRVNSNTHILAGSEIIIEDEVLIAPFCLITSNNHRYDLKMSIMDQGMKHSGEIIIGKGSWLGQNSKVLGGACLGSKVVVGAGAIASRGKYPDNCKLIGSSAKFKNE
jgi:acetyltransferase-like isoleucine patch superfamily enzyme